MKIEIAGAGAGKTSSLSEKIISRYKKNNDANIFCVSFTNSSVDIIKSKIEEQLGAIPENIKISTIHSFLNSQLINPYYFLLYGKQYKGIVSYQLDGNPRYANYTLSRLEEKNFLHVDQITKKAKYLICGKSNDKKTVKQKRDVVLNIISSSYDAIFVDEAQDIDDHFSQVLKTFDEHGIYIELIGDPKQDLKGNGILNNLLIEHNQEVNYVEGSYRCPVKHLNISNFYIPEEQKQKALNEKDGEVNFYFQSRIQDLKSFISKERYDLIYIYQKKEGINTSATSDNNSFFEETKQICLRIFEDRGSVFDENNIIYTASKICYLLKKNIVVNKMTAKESIDQVFKWNRLEKSEYAKLITKLQSEFCSLEEDGVVVDSISKVKGKEGQKCLFLISNALMPYLLMEKGYSDSIKMQSHLYVGLTRSTKRLDLLFLNEVENKYCSKKLQRFLDEVNK